MRVLREGENLRGRKSKPPATQPMKLVPIDSLSPEEQAKHRGRGKKSKRERKNVWVPA